MYTEANEHPIRRQTGEIVYVDAVEPHDRNQNLGMDIVRGIVVYDRAGRIPYDDVC